MTRFIGRRLAYSLLSLFLLSLTIFLFVRILPMISIFEMRTLVTETQGESQGERK